MALLLSATGGLIGKGKQMTKLAGSFKSKRTVVGAFLVLIAVVAAGCSSSSTGSNSTTTTSGAASSTTTATTAATTTTAASSSTTTTIAASSTTTTLSSSSFSGLLSKFQSGEHATFVATYKITSGASKELTSLTLAQQSPDQLFKGSTSTGTFEFLTLGTKSYLCSQSASAAATCFNSGASNPEAEMFSLYEPSKYLPYFEAAASAAGGHATASTKTVNGYPLSCVTVSGAANENGTGTFCVTGQGVLGYVAWTGTTAADSGSFEITSYSTTVPSGEFALPATPTSIP